MLENLYQTFGIFGSLVIALVIFLFIIFWIAGIAGLIDRSSSNMKFWHVALCVLFPPFPIGWLMYDMVRQYKAMHLE